MAITIRKQDDSEVAAPQSASRVSYYVDNAGTPKFKDSNGVVTPAVSVDGSPLTLNEQGSAPTAENDKGKIYTKDVGGITEFFYRDDLANTGKEVQITADGALNVATPPASLSVFFDSSQEDEQTTTVASGTGTVPLTFTGITLPALTTANQIFVMYIRAASALAGSVNLDAGLTWTQIFGWGASPPGAHPITGLNSESLDEFAQNNTNIATYTASIDTNASGNPILNFTRNLNNDRFVVAKMVVSPVYNVGFDPSQLP